jgi:hypothetical protein
MPIWIGRESNQNNQKTLNKKIEDDLSFFGRPICSSYYLIPMETTTFRLSDTLVCIIIRQIGIYMYADPIRLRIPAYSRQITKFPQINQQDVDEIVVGTFLPGEIRIILLENIPDICTTLNMIHTQYTHSLPFIVPTPKQEELAKIAQLQCRLADYMDTLMKFILNTYIHKVSLSPDDILIIQEVFDLEIEELYEDICQCPESLEKQFLMDWCYFGMNSNRFPEGDLDSLLHLTHILGHNSTCLGQGRYDLVI